MDVSVIIPVYNVEEYLDQCLLSVEDNDEVALEIICVNDGSTDGSLAIMRDHAARDGRVRIIDKENEGYGGLGQPGHRRVEGHLCCHHGAR